MPDFIDIHSHILPGFDDGASDLKEALQILQIASNDGISHIVATPHHVEGVLYQSPEKIITAVEELREKAAQNNIPIDILPGMEIRLSSELPDWIESREILTINQSPKFILVEFPFSELPGYATQICFEIRLLGFIPVIAHPERNSDVIRKPRLMEDFIRMECLVQLTSSSLIGHEGKSAQKAAYELINKGLAHIVASDSHAPHHRIPHFDEAYQEVIKLAGQEVAEKMFKITPGEVISTT